MESPINSTATAPNKAKMSRFASVIADPHRWLSPNGCYARIAQSATLLLREVRSEGSFLPAVWIDSDSAPGRAALDELCASPVLVGQIHVYGSVADSFAALLMSHGYHATKIDISSFVTIEASAPLTYAPR